ncbi:MAG: hypothetical protein HYS12_03935 [Planctomycetes bacterium]|nr:hypothetical protein [Planctomycetota bacterium]
MTIVGKILVFVNLVFSLVVGGLVMVVFMTRTNWEDHAKKLKAEYDVVVNDRDQTASEKQALQTKLTKREQDERNALVDLAKTIEMDNKEDEKKARELVVLLGPVEYVKQAAKFIVEAKREKDEAKAALATIQQGGVKGNADTTAAQAAAEARKDEIKNANETIAQLRTEIRKLINDANDERRERIRAQVAARTMEKANEQLEEQVRDLAKELARSKAGVAGTTGTTRKRGEENPPAEQVEGRITRVYSEKDLVQISVGSDVGLTQGHTLKVFRLDRVPENSRFLGVIEILSVRPHEAVGRLVRRTAYDLREGDRVASRITIGGG